MRGFLSVLLWIFWAVCIIFFFVLVLLLYLVTFPFDRYNRIPNKVLKGLAWVLLRSNPGWSFEVRGADPQKVNAPTIVVANHQSFLDMPLIYLLPWSMKWVAKKTLFRIPIFGWIIFMTGHMGIDRQSSRSVKKLDELVKPVKDGIPAMIFPEGTRTRDGKLKPFKNGAFKLAAQYNFRVLPIVLEGGHKALPSGSWKFHFRQKFIISVLDPVEPADFDSIAALKKQVYNEIKQELNTIRSTKS